MKNFTFTDIRNNISMQKAIDLMRDAFQKLSSGGAQVPVRTMIDVPSESGRVLFMPSHAESYNLFGVKMVSVFDHNQSKDLPIIQGTMLVMNGTNGTPLATIEAEYLTALRTGAASGLATDLLSRKDATVLAVFGTGTQAETQVEGILSVRPIQKVIVFGRSENSTHSFCEKLSERHKITFDPTVSLDDLPGADIICAATTSATPLFQLQHLRKGVHINGIGSYKPTLQEIPSAVIQQSLLVVDHREATLKEAGDIIIPIQQGLIQSSHIHAELGEIVSGKKSGRNSPDQMTVFKSVGNAIQDLALAHYLVSLEM